MKRTNGIWDVPIRAEWAALFVFVPMFPLAIAEGSLNKLILGSIAVCWAILFPLPRESLELRWVPVLWLILGIACGLATIGYRLPWLGPALCGLTIGSMALGRRVPIEVRWLAVSCALAAALLRGSSSDFGPNSLDEWLRSLGLTPEMAWYVTVGIRKSIHFIYFGLIGWTAYRASRYVEPRLMLWWPVGWVLFNAILDETRQAYSPGRTGSAWDVVLDLAGAIAFIALSHRRLGSKPKDPAADGAPAP